MAGDSTPPPTPRRWPAWLAPLLIVAAAVAYYGSYLRFWFNPHDEGGTAVLTAMRLLAGETPIREVTLGYNVGWFWPLVALFKVWGPNFLLTRAWFFGLSTITALLGWLTVRRLTRNEWAALAVGLACVVFPGSQFKNYIPLAAVANLFAVVHFARAGAARRSWSRMVLGGVVLGATFLVRIDLGFLALALWGGVLFLSAFDPRGNWPRALGGFAVLVATCAVLHLPAWLAARSGGYHREFGNQYLGWARFLGDEARAVVVSRPEKVPPDPPTAFAPFQIERGTDRSTLPRVSWATAKSFAAPDKSALFVLTYLPLLLYALLLGWAGVRVVAALGRREFALDRPETLVLIALIASLATFPQFFFFRPDRPHLSEFMPGCIVALSGTLLLLPAAWRRLALPLVAVQFGLFAWFALDHYSAGTIAARTSIRKSKRQLFEGANGVRVWVHKDKDYPEFEGVRRLVMEHSQPGEWLVCFPYQPGYNVFTDRPTYLHSLYQDNSTTDPEWSPRTIRQIQARQPAVVIVDDRAINKVEASKFSVWARPVHEFLAQNYDLRGSFGTVEVFCRKP
jgi:hypothetical protein